MIRPYLAIIKDSFRAAMATSVLYVLLGLITLILVVLAPLHIRESLDWEVSQFFLAESAIGIAQELVDKKNDPEQVIATRLWDRLTPGTQTKIEETLREKAANPSPEVPEPNELDSQKEPRRRQGPPNELAVNLARDLSNDLNDIMKDRGFYDQELWKKRVLNAEAKELTDAGVNSLSDIRLRRLNRLLINDTLRSMPAPSNSSAKGYYAFWHISVIPAEVTRAQLTAPIVSNLRFIFDKFVLSLGILIGIIVTANMVPETFEPGSLNLLLSKPIYRTGLLLSKFVGGTAFIALCGTYLFLGLYLWMGFGLGLWDKATLWSIPLYILVFAIYYSVSVLAGVVYRSAIVSVVLTGVFWAACFAVGSTYGFLNAKAQNDQLTWSKTLGDKTIALDKFSQVLSWQDKTWQPADLDPLSGDQEEQVGLTVIKYTANMPPFPMAEPVFDDHSKRTFFVTNNPMRMGEYGQGTLGISDPNNLNFHQFTAYGSMVIFPSKLGPLLVGNDGRIRRIDTAKLPSAETPEPDKKGRPVPLPDGALVDMSPDQPKDIREPSRVAIDSRNDEIAVFSGGTLSIYSIKGDRYGLSRQVEVDSGSDRGRMSTFLAFGGNHLAIAFGNARVILLDASTLKTIQAFRPETRSPPVEVRCDSMGKKFFVLFRNGRLWSLNTDNPTRMELAKIPNQGLVSGITADNQGQISVCHNIDRVTKFDSQTLAAGETMIARGDFIKNAYRYALKPIYTIFPKPGEFYKLVDYLSSSRDTSYSADIDLRNVDEYQNPWSPLWTGLGFMGTMLALSCWIFSRTDC